MSDYVIVSESTADLPDSVVQDHDIKIIPMVFNLDGKEYYDFPDKSGLDPATFYKLLREGKAASTVQVSTHSFTEIFEPILREGKDVIYLGFSSALSGTYNSSVLAAEELSSKYPERKIYAVDTLAASLGEGLLVYMAANLKREGKNIDEVKEWVEANRLHMCHWFTVDDLNHLKRGGRISATTALFGTMLGIKPILHVDNLGRLIPVDKVRGRKLSIDYLYDRMAKTAFDLTGATVFISHGDALEDAESLAAKIKKNFKVSEIVINFIGPTIGAHSGSGTIALFFMGSER